MAKSFRAIDQEIFSEKGRKDFKNRNHGLGAKRAFETSLALISIVVGVIIIFFFEVKVGGFVSAGAGVILAGLAVQSRKYKTIIERSEFLNALLSSLSGDAYDFCAIISQETNKIVYLNSNFQNFFPDIIEMETRSLSELLLKQKISNSELENLNEAINSNQKAVVEFELERGGKVKKLALTIEPIKRPEGFVAIRGISN